MSGPSPITPFKLHPRCYDCFQKVVRPYITLTQGEQKIKLCSKECFENYNWNTVAKDLLRLKSGMTSKILEGKKGSHE
jgi:hypothetical protein